jgi:lipopolysaccharide biosynthesis regulator YciM
MDWLVNWLVISILIGIICYLGWFNIHLENMHEKREQDLINRIMSRDYSTFVNAEIVKEQNKVLSPREIFSNQEEQGIPI